MGAGQNAAPQSTTNSVKSLQTARFKVPADLSSIDFLYKVKYILNKGLSFFPLAKSTGYKIVSKQRGHREPCFLGKSFPRITWVPREYINTENNYSD